MSYFAGALDALKREHQITQESLAKSVRRSQTQISHYLTGAARPDRDSLGRICAAFPQDAPHLLVAFLRDELPEGFENAVALEPIENRLRETPPPRVSLERLRPAVRELLEKVILRSEKSPAFLAFLESALSITAPVI